MPIFTVFILYQTFFDGLEPFVHPVLMVVIEEKRDSKWEMFEFVIYFRFASIWEISYNNASSFITT